jgi:hypothetical protein
MKMDKDQVVETLSESGKEIKEMTRQKENRKWFAWL